MPSDCGDSRWVVYMMVGKTMVICYSLRNSFDVESEASEGVE